MKETAVCVTTGGFEHISAKPPRLKEVMCPERGGWAGGKARFVERPGPLGTPIKKQDLRPKGISDARFTVVMMSSAEN